MSGLNDLTLPCPDCGRDVYFAQEGTHCAACAKLRDRQAARKDKLVARCWRRHGRSPTDAELAQLYAEPGMLLTVFLDYDARREPKTGNFCVKCQRDLKKGQPYRIVRVDTNGHVLHPQDYKNDMLKKFEPFKIGPDCAWRLGLIWSTEVPR